MTSRSPLASDPRRKPRATLRGFRYQFLRTLETWIELPAEHALCVEGAEDFDVLTDEEALTIQVKDTPIRPITLRSDQSIASITNFWQTKRSNPQVRVRYQLLTTATRGIESGNPFGSQQGIDHWDACKYPDTDISSLVSFLLSLPLPADLKEFLRTSSHESIRENLIQRIDWLTGNPDVDHIEEKLRRLLIRQGRMLDIPPIQSQDALTYLYYYIYKSAEAGNRLLFREDFLRELQNATSIIIPLAEFQRLQRLTNQILSSFGDRLTAAPSLDVDITTARHYRAPPLAAGLAARPQLVAELNRQVNDNRVVAIVGSVGTGKSVLA